MKKDYKPYCVVDAENRYKTLVLASKENGQEEIQYYKLAEGERLLDAPVPGGPLCKPRWTGTAWEESGTAEEIEAWKKENFGHEAEMPPVNPSPTMSERVASWHWLKTTNKLMRPIQIYLWQQPKYMKICWHYKNVYQRWREVELMAKVYAELIRKGLKTLENVPKTLQAEVQELLKNE